MSYTIEIKILHHDPNASTHVLYTTESEMITDDAGLRCEVDEFISNIDSNYPGMADED